MTNFNESGLQDNILKAIAEMGFETPTPIQAKTIPHILNSTGDLIALAQTGTGKTAAFGLPILNNIDPNNNNIQSLILCPTRELCMQITSDIEKFSKHMKNCRVTAVYGGANVEPQIKALKRGCSVVVGTPGRTLDLIKRRVLKVNDIKWLALDEADEMLNMGFKEDLDSILADTPSDKQTLLFSATMPKEIVRISKNYMTNPVEMSVGTKNAGADNVVHNYYMVQAKDRYKALKRIADITPEIYGIVFCRTRRETKEVAEQLITDGYSADALHGDLSQAQRDHVMGRFRKKHLQMLVATDVAARGIDINDLTHVINYNLPDDLEAYIHRSGRTGRAGKKGISISIIHSRESRRIFELEKISKKTFNKVKVPEGKDICAKQLFNLITKVETVEIDEKLIGEYLPEITEKLEVLSREELIKRFVSVEFNRFLAYYKNAPDLNERDKGGRDKGESRRKTRGSGVVFSRFYINAGSNEKLDPNRLMGLINEVTEKRDIEIGKIDIMKKFAFFEVDAAHESLILKSFQDASFDHRSVSVQLSKPDVKKSNPGRNKPYTSNSSSSSRSFGGDKRGGGSGGKKTYGKRRF